MAYGALTPIGRPSGLRAGFGALWRSAASMVMRNAAALPGIVRPRETQLVAIPADPWPGNPVKGQAILSGTFLHGSKTIPFGRGEWLPPEADAGWLAALHSFTWLRDVDAVDNPLGLAVMRGAVADWLDNVPELRRAARPLVWRPDVLGNRLLSLLSWFDRLTEDDEEFGKRLRQSLSEQGDYLAGTIGVAPPGCSISDALAGLFAIEFCLPKTGSPSDRRKAKALRLLDQLLRQQIHPDGGQIERSPRVQLDMLRSLIDMRAILRLAYHEVPDLLQQSIDRMAPILRFYRHGDGGLALFNDSNVGDAGEIDQVLAEADAAGKAPRSAPHTGFERMVAKRSVALVDVGSPAEIDTHAHAGTLSFEFSFNKERMIVNCGAYVGEGSPWRRAQRATAAHSTLTIDDANSSEIMGAGTLGKRARVFDLMREESEHGIWLEARHDGYLDRFKVIHQRRLFMAASGDDLRGEEILLSDGGAKGRFAVRFHLHHKVQASVAQDNKAVLLRLPSGAGWRLRVAGGAISLADSVYLGLAGDMRRARQVLIQGDIQAIPTRIKWALQREGPVKP
jgi:uncharacterized heparinase superfamily protein